MTLGVFFTFAYEKCGKNIWLPVVLHYLNNNMIFVWTGTADISNQIIGWGDVASAAVQYAALCSCRSWRQNALKRQNKKRRCRNGSAPSFFV